MQFSEEFISKIQNLLGDESSRFFDSLNQPSIKGITVNFSKLSKEQFEEIADFSITPVPEVDNGYIAKDLKIGNHPLSHLGVIYSQEPSAMYPVEMLDIEEGDIVLDLCSAPGGKSIQILEKLKGTGFLVSNEIVYNRAKILYQNLSKIGFNNYAITCNSPQDFEGLNMQFDKILVDAPCGGEGMFRKSDFDFDAYNNCSIESNAKRQSSILNSIKHLLKPNGKIVYSTCTYDIRENEEVVSNFVKENEDFQIIPYDRLNNVTVSGVKINNQNTHYTKRRYPHLFDGEGQYMALLSKSDAEDDFVTKQNIPGFENIYKKDVEILQKTFKNIANIKGLEIIKRNDNYYVIPNIPINLKGLNVVSIGTLMGNLQKGIFKIAHEFYHSCGHLFKNHINLSKEQMENYLRGYEIDYQTNISGICVVNYLSIPLGGGKLAGGKLKNYYPKPLRTN